MKATVDGFANMAVVKEGMVKDKIGQYFCLSILAGAYVGFGILLIFTVGGNFIDATPGVKKMVMGCSFGLALTLVIFAGSELFTGNNMVMMIGAIKGKSGWGMMLWLWVVCWFGNLVGALALAGVMSCTGLADGNNTGNFIGKVAGAKMNGTFFHLFNRAILCNMLVCLAVWMSAKAKDDVSKIFLIFWCLYGFIASGYEHSIANMTIFGTSLLSPHPDNVSCLGFAWNMLPVTLGNIVGGAFLGAIYCYTTHSPESVETLQKDGGVSLLMDDSALDEIGGMGDIGKLSTPLQPLLVKGQSINSGERVNKLESSLEQLIPQGDLYTQKYTTAAESCVKELTQWCDQLSSVLTHLRSQANVLSYEDFSEVLTQLQLQRDAHSPIYLKDALIRKLAEDMCPDFENYARGKGTIKSLSASEILPNDARSKIKGFIELCDKVESTIQKVKEPANYGRDLSGGQSLLTEAIFELNSLKFELNENVAAIS